MNKEYKEEGYKLELHRINYNKFKDFFFASLAITITLMVTIAKLEDSSIYRPTLTNLMVAFGLASIYTFIYWLIYNYRLYKFVSKRVGKGSID